MALFGKKDELRQETDKASKEAISSIISKEMRITGEIIFKGKARIDGTVDGNVKGEYLILSETGKINGDLEVGSLVCHGTVEGNIQAKLVTAHSSAAINGKLTTTNLTVESGASVNGEIRATSRQQTSSQPVAQAKKEQHNQPVTLAKKEQHK